MNVKPDFSKGHNLAETAPADLSIWELQSYYGESYIVQNISFNVHEGEIWRFWAGTAQARLRRCARSPVWTILR